MVILMQVFFAQEGTQAAQGIGSAAQTLAGNWQILAGGIILIAAAVLIFLFLKKLAINSALGLIAFAILIFAFKIDLPFIPTLVVSAIFGLAGIGVILVLKFLGVPI